MAAEARVTLETLQSDGAQQAACVRAMVAAFAQDPEETGRVMKAVEVHYRTLLGLPS